MAIPLASMIRCVISVMRFRSRPRWPMLYQASLVRLMAENPDVQELVTEVNHLIKPRKLLREHVLAQRAMALAKPG
jgi:hypothetical protein